jgi:hypothetical protein
VTTRRLKMVQAVLAGLTVLAASAELQDVLPHPWPTWIGLLAGSASAAVGFYTAHVGDMPGDDPAPGRHAAPDEEAAGA